MRKSPVKGAKQVFAGVLAIAMIVGLVACSSPTEKANAFYEKGMALLKEGQLDKAKLEFQNALQVQKTMARAMYGLALVAEQKGELQQEFKALQRVLEQNPKHVEALVRMGRLLLAAGKLEKAKDVSDRALAIKKDDASVLTLHAAVLLKSGDTKGAVDTAKQVLAKDPQHVDALVVLASERMAKKDFAQAVVYLDQGLKSAPKSIALHMIKIQALESMSMLPEVEQEFRKLIADHPESVNLRQGLAQFFLKHDRKDDAERELREVVKLNPNELQAKLSLARYLFAIKGADVARQELEGFVKQAPDNFELKFALVQFYLEQRDVNAAETALRGMIAQAGDSENGLRAKGQLAALMMTKGDKKAAGQLVTEILSKDKNNQQGLLLKANLEIMDGKLDDAIADLRGVLKDAPNSSRALLLLAQAHERARSLQLAEEHYSKAFQASKLSPEYGIAYTQFLLKRNLPQRAEKVLQDLLAKVPNYQPGLRLMAQVKLAMGDAAGAQAVAEEIRRAGDKEHVADQIMGAIFAGQKNYEGSIAAFKRAYETAPGEMQPTMGLVRAYLQAGKPKDAISFIEGVLQRNPDTVELRVLQGQLYATVGQSAQAIDAFSTVIRHAPKNAIGYQQLTGFYLRSKQVGDAEKVVAQGLQAVPGDPGLRLTQAGIFELTKRTEEAIAVYEGLLKDKPGAEVVVNNLASLLTETRTDKASFSRAYELAQVLKKTEIPQFQDTVGWASYKVGKHAEAASLLENAVKKIPEEPIFRYHLGMTYLAKGDKAGARRELEKALQLVGNNTFPQSAEIQNVLKAL